MARYCTRENEPLGKWNNIPIYLTTIVVAVMVAGLIISAVLQSLRSGMLLQMTFLLPGNGDMNYLAAITYPLIDRLNFFTPFSIFFLYQLGVGIETHLGRSVLTKLFLLLVFVPVAIALVMWWTLGVPAWLHGNYFLFMGLVVTFSTLYPNAEFFGWVPYKWVAFAALLCGSLMEMADRDWVSLVSLWGCAAAGFFFMRHAMDYEQDDHVPVAARVRSLFQRKPKLRVMPKPVAAPRTAPAAPMRPIATSADLEIDALLDKIAKSGLASLSNAERAKLERARQELLKKEQT